jgi:hypothetical protein
MTCEEMIVIQSCYLETYISLLLSGIFQSWRYLFFVHFVVVRTNSACAGRARRQ